MSAFQANTHAVFEASAGTGKTYSIVEYVLWAIEQGVGLEQILLVTFTEKAAGELKQRVRKGLEARLESSSKAAAVREALEAFDGAQIFTIHGFCQRVLRQNPLAGVTVKARMVNDGDIAETCLREFQRQEWRRRYKTDLLPVLEISGYCDEKSGGWAWESDAKAVVRQFKPECHHLLLPEHASEHTPASLETRLREILHTFEEAIGTVGEKPGKHPIVAEFSKLPMQWKTRESRRDKILIPLLCLTRLRWTERDVLLSFQDLVDSIREYTPYKESGFGALIETENGQLGSLTAHLRELASALDTFAADLARFQFKLSTETVRGVLETQLRYKRERGLQSYDDLLTQVHAAIFHPENGPQLINTLRRQYRVAIVDEFQDTDPVQWEIFDRVFLQAPGGQHALIIVGDPKQAIYSFRSADVNAYLKARDAVLKQNGARRPLDTCYRSSEAMNRALNAFFQQGALLTGRGIEYKPVEVPKQDCPRLDKDDSKRRALTILEFGLETGASESRAHMAKFIADECARLLEGPAIKFTRPKESRALNAGDIAVLFLRRTEAAPVEDALREKGIPYTFYKKSMMWSSDESVQMWYVLSALAEPEDRESYRKMLLTRLFGVGAAELRAYDEIAPDHPFLAMVQRWRELCVHREWAELFRSMLEDTGLLNAEAAQFDGARRVANWRFITQSLAEEAYASGLDITEVRELLRERRQLPSFDESNLHPLETERPAVKLMTVFASKGLEFPIVFLAGGYSSPRWRDPEFRKYHDAEGRVVYDFDPSKASKALSDQEQQEEHQRLFYVAMTRAMFKLYIPTQSEVQNKPGKKHKWDGPLKKVLSPCVQRALALNAPDIGRLDADAALKEPAPQYVETATTSRAVALPQKLLVEAELAPLASRRLRAHSYSGLVHAKKGGGFRLDEHARPPRDDDDDAEELKPDALPPGPQSGDALHTILELLDWEVVRNVPGPDALLAHAPSAELIQQALARHLPDVEQDDALWLRAAELACNVLRTPLKALEGQRLCDIAKNERSHEIEFHLPWAADIFSAIPEDLTQDGGFLTGFMDLVLRARGKFYLLDWKSNTLPSYAPPDVERDIKARRYDLQYRVYLQALQKWLSPLGVTPSNFGGVIYVYLRGVRPGDGLDGIYFRQPPALEWDTAKLIADLRTQALAQGSEGSS